MKKRLLYSNIISVVSAISLMIFSLPINEWAVCAIDTEEQNPTEVTTKWNGECDTSWYDSEETEFHISTPEELAGLSSLVNQSKHSFSNKVIYMDSDIDLSGGEWISIATTRESDNTEQIVFDGTFDGQNHTIKNLHSEYYTNGLFGFVSGTVKNTYLQGADIQIYDGISINKFKSYGGIVANLDHGIIENCHFSGTIKCNTTGQYYTDHYGKIGSAGSECNIGGIVGFATNESVISKCSCDGEIIENGKIIIANIGGICGKIVSSYIENCVNESELTTTGKYFISGVVCVDEIYIGGIVGLTDEDHYDFEAPNSLISNVYNTGDIEVSKTGTITGGGIAGKLHCCKIENAYNTGKLIDSTITNMGVFRSGAIQGIGIGIVGNCYYLSGTAEKGSYNGPESISKNQINMKKEEFADALGDGFVYVPDSYPKLKWELENQTIIENPNIILPSSFKIGEAYQFEIINYDGIVIWSSSDTDIMIIDENGLATAIKSGSVTVIATLEDETIIEEAIEIEENEIVINEKPELVIPKFEVGKSDKILISNYTGKITWASSDSKILAISEDGTATVHNSGVVTVTAVLEDNSVLQGKIEIEVSDPVVIEKPELECPSLIIGESKQLEVKNYSGIVSWASTDTNILSIDEGGLATAIGSGTVTIIAVLEDNTALQCKIEIGLPEIIKGDIDSDFLLTAKDILIMQKMFYGLMNLSNEQIAIADMNSDGKVNLIDYCIFIETILN